MDGCRVRDPVMVYGLSQSALDVVSKACAACKVEVYETDCLTDMIAVPSLLIVADLTGVVAEDVERLLGVWLSLDDPTMRVVLLGDVSIEIPPGLRRKIRIAPEPLSLDVIKFLILRQREALKRHLHMVSRFDRRIFRLMHILRELNVRREVSSHALAAKFNVSQRTVQRDIELLQSLGECIDYDDTRKRFSVPSDWSPLSSPIWD